MDMIFFSASKLIGVLIRTDMWIILSLAMIVLALKTQRFRLAFWLSNITLFSLLSLAIFPLGNLLLKPIEQSYPINPPISQVDGIIVLGGATHARASVYWEQMQINERGERFTESLALARRFPNAKLLFTGGSEKLLNISGSIISEAAIAKLFFVDQGIPPERLLLEERSRNTAENAHLSFLLVNPKPHEKWIVVTSAFHMPRAMRSFETAGWSDLVAWPVDYRTSRFVDGIGWNLTKNLKILNIAIREHVGQLVYKITGR